MEFGAYPAEVAGDLAFDATVKSQFLKDGDVIERGGLPIEVVCADRNEVFGVVAFSYYNQLGGIQSATIPWGVDVLLGTRV